MKTEINLEETVINVWESIKGSDILAWCKKHKDDENSEHQWYANNLYHEVWENPNVFNPNSKVYYYVEYYKDYQGFSRWQLRRDVDKSPR